MVPETIIVELQATTREGVIHEMVESLRSAGYVQGTESKEIIQAVLRREQLRSTGIGGGVAIPHAKHGRVGRVIAALAVSRKGVPFDCIDNEPIHVFALLLSPPDQTRAHLRALEVIARRLSDEGVVRSLRQATTADAIWSVVDKQEAPCSSSADELAPSTVTQDPAGAHLRALELICRRMRDESFVHSLRQATTADAIWSLLEEVAPLASGE
jgi:mannitol/fructose-specific phosphotransferase system IIA component (Ntr-type)